jgi:hypothetical protein
MIEQKYCSLDLKLVEDLPGEHIYIHFCRGCGRECGPEFVVFHKSSQKPNEPLPVVTAPICVGRQGGVLARISECFENIHGFGLAATNA